MLRDCSECYQKCLPCQESRFSVRVCITLANAGAWLGLSQHAGPPGEIAKMQNRFALEICVESVERAIAAERGGAHRVELCSDLASGGITPSAGTLRVARQNLRIPIHVLIRPRAGDFVYSDREFEVMERDIELAQQLGMNSVVLGILDSSFQVDVKRTTQLVKLAHPLPVTFHRAFDLCPDKNSALDAVIQSGSTRLLTSGGNAGAIESLASMARLVGVAGDRLVIMPAGGICAENVSRVLQETAAREIHASLRGQQTPGHDLSSKSGPSDENGQNGDFEAKVREVRRILNSLSDRVTPSC
jgi:copper homeostasis protein